MSSLEHGSIGHYGAVLLDIEGTTTSISFVYDELFPYARRELDAFLEDNWGREDVQEAVELIREQSREDRGAGIEGVVEIPDEGDASAAEVREAVAANVRWQMDDDRKTTGLKQLQGLIWRDGYASGDLKGHIFNDVPEALEIWLNRGVPVYIYSSGSVEAQKLLFSHTTAGDLTHYLTGYFDTTTGGKKKAPSYRAIAREIERPANDIVFVTDNLEEAEAADEAGCKVVISVRPGNPRPVEHDFPDVVTLIPVVEELKT